MWPSRSKKRAKRATQTSTKQPTQSLHSLGFNLVEPEFVSWSEKSKSRKSWNFPFNTKIEDLYLFEVAPLSDLSSGSFSDLFYCFDHEDRDILGRIGPTILSYMFGWSLTSLNENFLIFQKG